MTPAAASARRIPCNHLTLPISCLEGCGRREDKAWPPTSRSQPTCNARPCVASPSSSGVLVLTFDRPERKNSWNIDVETQYFDALEAASSDSNT